MATMPYGIYNLKSFKRLSIGQINCMNEPYKMILYCSHGHLYKLKNYDNYELKINVGDKNLFYMAAEKGHIHILNYLLRCGFNISDYGKEAYLIAAKKRHIKTMEFLERNNCYFNIDKLIDNAAKEGNFKITLFY